MNIDLKSIFESSCIGHSVFTTTLKNFILQDQVRYEPGQDFWSACFSFSPDNFNVVPAFKI